MEKNKYTIFNNLMLILLTFLIFYLSIFYNKNFNLYILIAVILIYKRTTIRIKNNQFDKYLRFAFLKYLGLLYLLCFEILNLIFFHIPSDNILIVIFSLPAILMLTWNYIIQLKEFF